MQLWDILNDPKRIAMVGYLHGREHISFGIGWCVQTKMSKFNRQMLRHESVVQLVGLPLSQCLLIEFVKEHGQRNPFASTFFFDSIHFQCRFLVSITQACFIVK